MQYKMTKAVFLDRDGTINEDVGDLYLPEQLKFIPGAIRALKMLQEKFLLFIVTNQSGIGRGSFSEVQFLAFDEYFRGLLRAQDILIQNTYFCPHTKEQSCVCKKPNIHYIRIVQQYYDIDLTRSFVVGDHPHDIEMAHNAGTKSIYLLTGHGEKHREDLKINPDFIAKDLYEAATWIIEKDGMKNYAAI